MLIFDALVSMRYYLKEENRPTDAIDEILLKISESYKVELDNLDARIIIHSLDDMRDELKEKNEPRGEINNIILKVIGETEKKTIFKEKER